MTAIVANSARQIGAGRKNGPRAMRKRVGVELTRRKRRRATGKASMTGQLFLRRLGLKIEGVKFPASAVETKKQPDAFVLNCEIARTRKERIPELRPIERLD